jgi:hypothetical protein
VNCDPLARLLAAKMDNLEEGKLEISEYIPGGQVDIIPGYLVDIMYSWVPRSYYSWVSSRYDTSY